MISWILPCNYRGFYLHGCRLFDILDAPKLISIVWQIRSIFNQIARKLHVTVSKLKFYKFSGETYLSFGGRVILSMPAFQILAKGLLPTKTLFLLHSFITQSNSVVIKIILFVKKLLRPSSDVVLLPCRTKLQFGSTVARQEINSDSDQLWFRRRASVESNSGFTGAS